MKFARPESIQERFCNLETTLKTSTGPLPDQLRTHFWNRLGQTHRPTDEICSFRVDPGEVLQFKNGPKTSTGALTDQLQTWYFIIITGHLWSVTKLVTNWSVTKLVTDWSVTTLVTNWSVTTLVTDWSVTKLVIKIVRSWYDRVFSNYGSQIGQWPHWSPTGQWPHWSPTGQWPNTDRS
jgi:hypothetical protein